MKFRRYAALSLCLFLVAGSAAVANSRWGSYEGYSKIMVRVNDSALNSDSVPPFVINGSSMLPLRQVADTFNAIVRWDSSNQTANIFKPNVNMIVAREVAGKSNTIDRVTRPFYFVAQDSAAMNFNVFVQVDNLKTSASKYKISIHAPNGTELDSREGAIEVNQDYLWITCPFNMAFSAKGKYTVRFALEVDGKYTTVGEKLIVSE